MLLVGGSYYLQVRSVVVGEGNQVVVREVSNELLVHIINFVSLHLLIREICVLCN